MRKFLALLFFIPSISFGASKYQTDYLTATTSATVGSYVTVVAPSVTSSSYTTGSGVEFPYCSGGCFGAPINYALVYAYKNYGDERVYSAEVGIYEYGTTSSDHQMTFNWNEIPGADGYILKAYHVPPFIGTQYFGYVDISTTNYTIGDLSLMNSGSITISPVSPYALNNQVLDVVGTARIQRGLYVVGSATATTYYGDGSNLTGIESGGSQIYPSTGTNVSFPDGFVAGSSTFTGQIFTGSGVVSDYPHIIFPATTDSAVGFLGTGNQIDVVDHGVGYISLNSGADGGVSVTNTNSGFSSPTMTMGRVSPTEAVTGFFGDVGLSKIGLAVGSSEVGAIVSTGASIKNALSVYDDNSGYQIFLGTLPKNGGFGPQLTEQGVWAQGNGSYQTIITTVSRMTTAGGAPYLPADGASLIYSPSSLSYSTYNYLTPTGTQVWRIDSTGFTLPSLANNSVIGTDSSGYLVPGTVGGGGYAVEPATVTFQLNQGMSASTGVFVSSVSVSTGSNVGTQDFDVLSFGQDPDFLYSGLPLRLTWSNPDTGNNWLQFDDGAGSLQTMRANINADSVVDTALATDRIVYSNSGNLATDTDLYWNASTNQLGIGTGTPAGSIGFGGDVGRTIMVGTTTSLSGKALEIRAGAAQTGSTNRSGGDLILTGGNATGNGTSAIRFFTASNGASGTAYSTSTEKASIRPNGGFWFGSGAGTGFVNSSINPGIDISYGGSPAGLVLGAESNLTTRTNNTAKNARIGMAPYSSSQLLMTCLIGNTGSSSNTLAWGGGTSIAQAATQQDFYTGPYNTVSPPSRLTINSTGDVIVTTGTLRVGTNTYGVVMSSMGYVSARGPFTVAGGSTTLLGLVSAPNIASTGTVSVSSFNVISAGGFYTNNQLVGLAISTYSTGAPYNFTTTTATLAIGTSSSTITLTSSGTYRLDGLIDMRYSGATFAGNEFVTLNLYRQNNTPGVIANSQISEETGIVTALTNQFGKYAIDPIFYTTTNTNDVISIHGSITNTPGAGNFQATKASLTAQRLY